MFSPPCTPTSINTKGSDRSPALTTHLVKSALWLMPRSISWVFSYVSYRRVDGPGRAQNNCIPNRYHPICPNASVRLNAMGLGPPILALYRQLKLLGALDGIDSVVELGSQGVWCPDRRLLTGLFEAFGRAIPPSQELEVYINATGTGHAASRHLHEKLGFNYDCVDIDGNFGSLTLDINFDSV